MNDVETFAQALRELYDAEIHLERSKVRSAIAQKWHAERRARGLAWTSQRLTENGIKGGAAVRRAAEIRAEEFRQILEPLANLTARSAATKLNREGVRGVSGGLWYGSTVTRARKRLTKKGPPECLPR